MTDEDLLNVIQTAIREETDDPSITITSETTANHVPGWDSLAHVRIVLNIEVQVGAPIDISATYTAADVGELVAVIRDEMAKAQSA